MFTAAVITISTKGAKGERVDTSGPNLVKMLKEDGYDVKYTNIIPDDRELIKKELLKAEFIVFAPEYKPKIIVVWIFYLCPYPECFCSDSFSISKFIKHIIIIILIQPIILCHLLCQLNSSD